MVRRYALPLALLLIGLAAPAHAAATIESVQGYDLLIPDGWITVDLDDTGTMLFPTDEERYGAETEVVVMPPVKRDGRSDQELIDLMLEKRLFGGELFPIGELVHDEVEGVPVSHREYIVNDHGANPLRFLAVAVLPDRNGDPFIISYEGIHETGFFWASYVAGLSMGAIHSDVSNIDLANFELPEDIHALAGEDEETPEEGGAYAEGWEQLEV